MNEYEIALAVCNESEAAGLFGMKHLVAEFSYTDTGPILRLSATLYEHDPDYVRVRDFVEKSNHTICDSFGMTYRKDIARSGYTLQVRTFVYFTEEDKQLLGNIGRLVQTVTRTASLLCGV